MSFKNRKFNIQIYESLEVSEFELHSHYHIHVLTNTLRKSMNPLIPPSYVLNSATTILK